MEDSFGPNTNRNCISCATWSHLNWANQCLNDNDKLLLNL